MRSRVIAVEIVPKRVYEYNDITVGGGDNNDTGRVEGRPGGSRVYSCLMRQHDWLTSESPVWW
jgi:hypothetical protein